MATTKITQGKSFARAIDYDLQNGRNREDQEKIQKLPATENETFFEGFKAGQRARLLETNLIGDTPAEFAEQFENVARQKPNKKEPVHKVSINLKPGEHLETHEWLEVGHSYLREMGYADGPYLFAQHREKDHEHLHIVASKVKFDGSVVSDSFEKRRARTWARGIEEKYDLHRTPGRAAEKGLSRIEIEQSIKTKLPPPKLILQESIKKTLAANQQTPDFLDALEQQNISVRVRANEQKEIIGISYAIGGRAFKGSTLGTKFTWKGLQKEGLKYEFERDYERLEETSRRASREKLGRAESARLGTGTVFSERIDDRSAGRSQTEDVQIVSGGTESDYRIESGRSIRKEIAGKPIERLESGNETGLDFSPVGSVSLAAGTDEQLAEKGRGESEEGNEREFRRSERLYSGEDETFGRDQPEIGETVAAEENSTEAAARPRSIDWLELDEEYFREQQSKQQSEFFEQSAVDYLLSAGTDQQPDAVLSNGADLPGAGTGATVLDGNFGISGQHNGLDVLAHQPPVQSDLAAHEGIFLDVNGDAGSASRVGVPFGNDSDYDRISLGNPLPDENSAEKLSGTSTSLSDKLRASLEDAETTAKKTVELHDDLIAEDEKQKQIKIEQQTAEFELEIGRILSL